MSIYAIVETGDRSDSGEVFYLVERDGKCIGLDMVFPDPWLLVKSRIQKGDRYQEKNKYGKITTDITYEEYCVIDFQSRAFYAGDFATIDALNDIRQGKYLQWERK